MKLESLLKKVYLLMNEIIMAVENDSRKYAIRKKVKLERNDLYIHLKHIHKILNANKLFYKNV